MAVYKFSDGKIPPGPDVRFVILTFDIILRPRADTMILEARLK